MLFVLDNTIVLNLSSSIYIYLVFPPPKKKNETAKPFEITRTWKKLIIKLNREIEIFAQLIDKLMGRRHLQMCLLFENKMHRLNIKSPPFLCDIHFDRLSENKFISKYI